MEKLTLQIAPESWQLFAARKADPAFARFATKIHQRDNYTCQYCGFQAKDYLEVVNRDGNYNSNKAKNMMTACSFCAQCLFLDTVGLGEYGGGTLIYLPEIPQHQLNSLCHVLFCAITNDTGYKTSAKAIYRSFKFRAKAIDEKFGRHASNPVTFAQLYMELDLAKKPGGDAVLDKLRLLPSRIKFIKQIERWASAALEELSAQLDVGTQVDAA